jgi:hypothetical protein
VGHQLATVADTQNGQAHLKNSGIYMGAGFQVHGIGAAGKDNTDGIKFPDLFYRSLIGLDFAVDIAFTNTAGDKLIILSTEVQDEDFLRHGLASCCQFFFTLYSTKICRFLQDLFSLYVKFSFITQFTVGAIHESPGHFAGKMTSAKPP